MLLRRIASSAPFRLQRTASALLHRPSQVAASARFEFTSSSSSHLRITNAASSSSSAFSQLRHVNTVTSSYPSSNSSKKSKSRFSRFLNKLAMALGVSAIIFTSYGIYLMRNEEERSWQLLMWKTLPLRFLSHLWGSIHRIDLPVFLRRPLYLAWTRAFDCQLHEIQGWKDETTLDAFPNLNAFFIRRLDLAKFRPLASDEMISPVDGRVNIFGEITPEGTVEQIKGMSYRVDDLLGFKPKPSKPDSRMYYYVFYLAPGDYHRMHTPSACTISERRHFPGALYPVLPSIAQYIPSLFVRNERVVLSGEWSHGFFAMVPVGAYNVGSMKLTFDNELDTNLREHTFIQYRPNLDDGLKAKPFLRSYRKMQEQHVKQLVHESEKQFTETDPASKAGQPSVATTTPPAPAASAASFTTPSPPRPHLLSRDTATNEIGQHVARVDDSGVHLAKGDEFARFELGSTIVVFFELEKEKVFNWNIEPHQKVRLGQRLGVILEEKKEKQIVF